MVASKAWRHSRLARADRLPRALRTAVLAGVVALLLSCTPPPQQHPPAGGRKLLSGAQSATATVHGRIRDPRRIDPTGYTATITIDHIDAGALPSNERVVIGWEELSPSRPPRFKDGDQVLAALAPLPTASLWRTRFPQANAAREVFLVAENGDAFMLHPDRESILTLATYLKLPTTARSESAGATALAAIVARAAPDLAVAAATQIIDLSETPSLAAAAEKDLAQALKERASPRLQSLIIEIAARYRVAALRPQLDALGNTTSDLAFSALMAVAAIDGSMPDDKVETWLGDPNPVKRMVAVHMARGGVLEQAMPLLHSDTDARVRAAVVHALINQRGTAAMAEVMRALADPEVSVRTEAATALGGLGAAVVSPLLNFAESSPREAAEAAVLGLESTGAAGTDALQQLAHDHPDESVRRLAKLALGKLEDPH